MLAAALVANLAGADWTVIRQVAREFTGVPHRLEKVALINGVTYYNDSIATSPSRTIAGIKAFSQPIILIAGGYDKQLSFAEMARVIKERVKDLILFGAAAAKIKHEMQLLDTASTIVHHLDDLNQAVALAANWGYP